MYSLPPRSFPIWLLFRQAFLLRLHLPLPPLSDTVFLSHFNVDVIRENYISESVGGLEENTNTRVVALGILIQLV